MFQEQVDMVAGDFNGVSWRCSQAMNSDPLALSGRRRWGLANTCLAVPPGPTPLWRPGGVPGEWADVCGFIKPPGSE